MALLSPPISASTQSLWSIHVSGVNEIEWLTTAGKSIDFSRLRRGLLPSQAPENIRPGKCWGVKSLCCFVEQTNITFSSIGEIHHVPRTDDDGLRHERVKINQSKGICFNAKSFNNLVTTGGRGYGKFYWKIISNLRRWKIQYWQYWKLKIRSSIKGHQWKI